MRRTIAGLTRPPTFLVALLPALLLFACGGSAVPSAGPPVPAGPGAAAGAAADAAAAAVRADDAARVAYSNLDDRPLFGLFSGGALVAVRRDLAGLAARGVHRDERLQERTLVHESVRGQEAEVVLQVRAAQRLVAAGSDPRFVTVLRQWSAQLRLGAGGWTVVDFHDLRPDQWWPAPGSAGSRSP